MFVFAKDAILRFTDYALSWPQLPSRRFHDEKGNAVNTTLNVAPAPLPVTEIKAFVPARDFALSKRFYLDLGFTMAFSDDEVAYFHCGDSSFLLQCFYVTVHADNFMRHLLTPDVEAWWAHVAAADIANKYAVRVTPIELQPWAMRDFTLTDPSGVLWRIAQNVPRNT